MWYIKACNTGVGNHQHMFLCVMPTLGAEDGGAIVGLILLVALKPWPLSHHLPQCVCTCLK